VSELGCFKNSTSKTVLDFFAYQSAIYNAATRSETDWPLEMVSFPLANHVTVDWDKTRSVLSVEL